MVCRSASKASSASTSTLSLNPKGTNSTLILDVTFPSSISDAAALVQQQFGHLDVPLNNAGIGCAKISDVYEQFRTVLDSNVLGPAVVASTFRPLLLQSSNPYSIYVSSGAQTLVRNAPSKPPHFPQFRNVQHAYQVSKAALNMLAVLEQRDYGDKGFKVFALSPGLRCRN